MDLDRTTLSRNLKLLEGAGLLTLNPGKDQRTRLAALTEQGAEVLLKALPVWEEAKSHDDYSHRQSSFQHARVLGCEQDLPCAQTRYAETANGTLLPILLLHSFRHLGLMFLAPGATYAGMPAQFAYPAAFGDLLAAVLALAAVPAVAKERRIAWALVWVFNLEGSLDLIAAIALATVYDVSAYMGAAYWIPAFWVPALLVTHYITFIILRKYWTRTV